MSDLLEYQAFYETFDPTTLTDAFAGDLAGLNACVECCDRHVGDGRVALHWASASGERATYTFEDPAKPAPR